MEMLGQGRAILWSQVRRLRTPLDSIADLDALLRQEFLDITRKLEALSASSDCRIEMYEPGEFSKLASGRSPDRFGEIMKVKRELSAQPAHVIDKIRNHSGADAGFKDVLRLPSYGALRNAAAGGTVIIVNHAKHRSDALIVLVDRDPVCIPLSAGFFQETITLAKDLRDARPKLKTKPKRYSRVLRTTLQRLWDLLGDPVVQALDDMSVEGGSRIWWCPTSVVTALPLHAAGPVPLSPASSSRKKIYILDLCVSSYTPTLGALIEARRGATSSPPTPATSFVVARVDASLQNVEAQVAALKSMDATFDLLESNQATPTEIIEHLKQHRWTHFACHGTLRPGEPFESAFMVAGK